MGFWIILVVLLSSLGLLGSFYWLLREVLDLKREVGVVQDNLENLITEFHFSPAWPCCQCSKVGSPLCGSDCDYYKNMESM